MSHEELKPTDIEASNKESSIEISGLYSRVESRPVLYGYQVFFATQEGADQAVKNFWSEVWSAAPDAFARGMWKPQQQLTGGIDYRTEPLRNFQITQQQRDAGIVAGYYFGGNGEPIPQKGLDALKDLGLIEI